MAEKNKQRSNRISEEDELESAYRSVSGSKAKNNDPVSRSRTPVVIVICIAVIAILMFTAAGCMYVMNVDLNGVILQNISVAGVDVGGMSQADAIVAVQAATENTYDTIPMVVKVLENSVEIPVSCVGELNVRKAVRAAYKFGNSGSADKRQQEQQIAKTTGYAVDLAPYLDLKEKEIRQILSELGANYNTALKQTTYEITGSAPSLRLVVQLGVPEYGLDLNQLYQQVLTAYSANQFEVTGQCGILEPTPINLEEIREQSLIAPVNAYFDKSAKTIVPEVNGYGFDIEQAKTMLTEAKPGATVEIPFIEIKPEITSEILSAMLYKDTLGTFSVSASSSSNRKTNLRLACEAINGVILYPGDVFSYNDTLGERTTDRGYLPAPSYAGNETVMTPGGGICQVSSTLYHCALQAELEVVLRKNHGFMPSYMPLGLDATVNWGTIDFQFKNNLDYPVKIEAAASGGRTTISILGTETRDYRVELKSEVLSKIGYKTIYKTMSPDNPEGYKDGDYITTPYTGYKVNSYLCKYAKDSDKLISKELIAYSVYKKRDAVICKIESSNTETTPSTTPPSTPDTGSTESPSTEPPSTEPPSADTTNPT